MSREGWVFQALQSKAAGFSKRFPGGGRRDAAIKDHRDWYWQPISEG